MNARYTISELITTGVQLLYNIQFAFTRVKREKNYQTCMYRKTRLTLAENSDVPSGKLGYMFGKLELPYWKTRWWIGELDKSIAENSTLNISRTENSTRVTLPSFPLPILCFPLSENSVTLYQLSFPPSENSKIGGKLGRKTRDLPIS